MDDVSVVPHDAEVRCRGLQGRQLAADVLGVEGARRVGEHRDSPHALDQRVLHQFADLVQVRAILEEIHGDHLETEVLGDRVVAVVARNRADPLELLALLRCLRGLGCPRLGGIVGAERVCPGHQVKSHVQRGGVAADDVLRLHADDLRPDVADIRNAGQPAVVAGVRAIGGGEVLAREAEQIHREVELFRGRLTAGEIQLQALGLEICILLLDLWLEGKKLVTVDVCELHGADASCVWGSKNSVANTIFDSNKRPGHGLGPYRRAVPNRWRPTRPASTKKKPQVSNYLGFPNCGG